jgi:uncharacterized iron-regulated membrane protein
MTRSWVFRIHLWLGVLAGAFFVVLGITGSILAFESPLDHIANSKLSYVASSDRNLSLDEIILSVKKSFPMDDVVAVTFAKSSNLSWEVALPSGIACVNPHTGQVLGLRERGQTFLGFARQLHVCLATGTIGRTVVQWSNLAALLLLLSGFGLWWPTHRIRLRAIDGTRRFWSYLHNAIGILSFTFLLVAAGTGAVMSFEAPITRAIRSLSGAKEVVSHQGLVPPISQGVAYIEPGQALLAAEAIVPNGSPIRIQMPAYGGTYRVSMTEHRLMGSDIDSVITIDPYTGKELSLFSSSSLSLTERTFATNEALHSGSLLGTGGRTLMAIACAMILPQFISGLMMWWKRGRARSRRKVHFLAEGGAR